jgi:integrase
MARESYPWYRRSKRAWYVTHEGKQKRLHPDKQEAFRLWHELQTRPPGGGLSVADLVRAYLDAAAARLAPRTLKTKREILLPLSEALGAESAATFEAQRWLDGKRSWGRSQRWLAALTVKAAWRWAMRRRPPLLETNPLEGWTVPAPLSRGTDAVVAGEGHAALVSSAPSCYRDALTVLHATGMRPGELCAIEARHVALEAGVVVLDEHKTDATGKVRVVILPPAAVQVFRALVERHPDGKLFRNACGTPLNVDGLGRWMRRARRRLKLPRIIPYGYRHTLATDALANGTPDAIVAQLLGHGNTAVLHRHYSHLLARVQSLKDAANKVRPQGGA